LWANAGPLRFARSFPLVVFLAAAFSACGGAPGASERLSDWLSVDARTKTVTLRLHPEYNRVYAGFNFNGYGKARRSSTFRGVGA
jgi:hypothetical protein